MKFEREQSNRAAYEAPSLITVCMDNCDVICKSDNDSEFQSLGLDQPVMGEE